MDLLNATFGPFSVLQWGGGLVLFGVLVGFWNTWSASRSPSGLQGKLAPASCLSCGWKGKVSKFHRTCPKCGDAITRTQRR